MNAKPQHESINVETRRTCLKKRAGFLEMAISQKYFLKQFFSKSSNESLFLSFLRSIDQNNLQSPFNQAMAEEISISATIESNFLSKIPKDLHSSPFSFIPSSFGLRIYSSTVSASDRSFCPISPNHRSLIPIGIRLLILTIDANKFN